MKSNKYQSKSNQNQIKSKHNQINVNAINVYYTYIIMTYNQINSKEHYIQITSN